MKKQLPILVVDSQMPIRQVLAATLHDMGFAEVIQAASGQEAMRILKTTPVAAVISDWNMPGMTGLGLLRWVRCEPALASLPFVLVTAETDRERMRQAISAGASEYLVKPYTVQDLANKVRKIVDPDQCDEALSTPAGNAVIGIANANEMEARIKASTVLIVDDVPINIEVIAAILEGECAIMKAYSGSEALQLVREGRPPDLILLDVMMPEIDGYAVCRQLKADPATRDIPIIFLTGNDGVQDVVRGFEIGAIDYISKPAEPSILKARIRTHLRLKLAFADLARQHAALAASAKLREDVARITQHDLKNPIASIITGTDMLLDSDGLRSTHTDMLRLIQDEAWRALDQVNQSLNLYRMETGAFQLRPERVDVVTTLASVRGETLKAFAGRSLDIVLTTADGSQALPGRFVASGEKGLCYSLFCNLLRNAAEASSKGGKIDVRFLADEQSVTVTIHNDKAVPEAIRGRFFDKYVTAGKAGGTGLGTYSAKLVTEAQHGVIAMSTDETTGTTLTVQLPAAGT